MISSMFGCLFTVMALLPLVASVQYSATDKWFGTCGIGQPGWVDFYPSAACSSIATTCNSGCTSDLKGYMAQKYATSFSLLIFNDSSTCTTPVYALGSNDKSCVDQSSMVSQKFNSDGSLTINFYQASTSCSGSPIGSITVTPDKFSACIQNYDGSYMSALIAQPGNSATTGNTTTSTTSIVSPKPNEAMNIFMSFSSLMNLIWMILM